jgi:hypothetical protein
VHLFLSSMFLSLFCLIFFNIKKKIRGEDAKFLFFLF